MLDLVATGAATDSAPTYHCNLNERLYVARWLYEERIENWNLVYLPDFTGMPLLLNDAQKKLLDCFTNGSTVGEILARAQHSTGLTFDELLNTVFLLEDKGFLRGEKDEPRFRPAPLPELDEMGAMNVWLHVNNNCNLACAYCFVNHTRSALTEESRRFQKRLSRRRANMI